jgi:hypothetical protein
MGARPWNRRAGSAAGDFRQDPARLQLANQLRQVGSHEHDHNPPHPTGRCQADPHDAAVPYRGGFSLRGRALHLWQAIQTTAVLSDRGTSRIALFLTGQSHAGENLEAILAHRSKDFDQPIQMCDALAANMVGDVGALNTILAHCLVHARRKFVEVETKFPEDVQPLLEALKVVYRNDALAKDGDMDPTTRLAFHQKESGPVMKALEDWLRSQIEEHKVEPNSGLGKAIKYMRKHWKENLELLSESHPRPANAGPWTARLRSEKPYSQ